MQTPVQKFTEALENWQEANRAYHHRKDELVAQGEYSLDYYLHPEREAMDRATKEMQEAFVGAVADAVRRLK